MKLLLDENLSFRLLRSIERCFPGSSHVRDIGLASADDGRVWQFARDNGFAIVTLDSDFHEMSILKGSPPKVVWLQLANTATDRVRVLLHREAAEIVRFLADPAADCLVLTDR